MERASPLIDLWPAFKRLSYYLVLGYWLSHTRTRPRPSWVAIG